MSEHLSEQATPGNPAETASGPTGAPLSNTESPRLAPDQELSAPPPDDVKPEMPKAEMPKDQMSKAEMSKAEAPKADAPRAARHITIMAPSRDESWRGATIDHDAGAGAAAPSRMGRLSALAAVAVVAAIAGAIGGSLAAGGFGRSVASAEPHTAASHAQALQNSVTRLESEVAALKSGLDRTNKGDSTQLARVNDRLDKMEKAQAEPAAKLAKLSETVDKLRVASAAPAASAKDVTGSISPTAAAAAPVPVPAPKPEFARLPTVQDWVLRDVANGGALIEGRQGMYEVYAGDPVPGLGRVDAIRKQDGRWVVVTSRGLIVAR